MQLVRIERAVKDAVQQAMASLKDEAEHEYNAARAADRKARKAKPRNGARWVESYPLTITRTVEYERQNADVAVEGAPAYYRVQENSRWNKEDHEWSIYMIPRVGASEIVDTVKNFETGIQMAVVMALGAAYYDSPTTTEPAQPGRKRA